MPALFLVAAPDSIDLLETCIDALFAVCGQRSSTAEEAESVGPTNAGTRAESQKLEEVDKAVDGDGVDRMLYAAGVRLGLFLIELQGRREKLPQYFMTVHDALRDIVSPGGKGYRIVRVVVDKTAIGQRPQRPGHRGALNPHLIGNIFGAGHSVGFLEVENHLQVIFHACGKPFRRFGGNPFSIDAAWFHRFIVRDCLTNTHLPELSCKRDGHTLVASSQSQQNSRQNGQGLTFKEEDAFLCRSVSALHSGKP